MNTIIPPCYPARPVNGGPLHAALPKSGLWSVEAKYNGWRAWVHNPTGAMFNRHLKPLSITSEFEPALAKLKTMPWEWSDVEALERRHAIGRGSLILLDYLPANRQDTFLDRKSFLEFCVGVSNQTAHNEPTIDTHKSLDKPIEPNRLYLPMTWRWAGADQLWPILQKCNQALHCEFFEGLVAKRNDSIYPMQNRSGDVEFPFWMKHRWAF